MSSTLIFTVLTPAHFRFFLKFSQWSAGATVSNYHFPTGHDVVAHPCLIFEQPHFVHRQKRKIGCLFQLGHFGDVPPPEQIPMMRFISDLERLGYPANFHFANALLRFFAWVSRVGALLVNPLGHISGRFNPRRNCALERHIAQAFWALQNAKLLVMPWLWLQSR